MKITRSRIFASSVGGVAIVFIAIFSMLISPAVNAATWDFRGAHYGYFDNRFGNSSTPYPSGKGPVLPNNDYATDSIPASVNSTAALYQFLYDKYTHTGPYGGTNPAYIGVPRAQAWDQTGASFIVNSLLGRSGPQASRGISNADWANLQQRLAATTLVSTPVSTSQFGCINTYYQYGNNDVSYYGDCNEVRQAMVLWYNGSIVYVIFYSCANPIGNFPGLPDVGYTLTPNVTVDKTTLDSGGGTAQVTGSVTNNGATTPASTWQLTGFVVPPGIAIPAGGTDALTPENHFQNSAKRLDGGIRAFPGRSTTALSNFTDTIGSYDVGTHICYALSFNPASFGSTQWLHSDPKCIVISTKPKVQIIGGDLMVGRQTPYNASRTSNIITSTSFWVASGLYYGSWGEYALTPTGTVTGMASGAGYAGGSPTQAICSKSVLTISNSTGASCPATVGKYTSSGIAPDIASRFTVNNNIGAASVDLSSLASGGVYSISGPTLNITNSTPFGVTANKGRWVVIDDPQAVVTIKSNLLLTPQRLNSIYAIPQIVIIAKNIIIDPAVTEVDAWLVAAGTGVDGYINTCSTVTPGAPTSLTVNSKLCNLPLTVNGPILTNHLYMYRTGGAGAGTHLGDPAETFNLRADAFLWATGVNNVTGRIQSVSTQELPPRF